MSLRSNKHRLSDDDLDALIRWGLYDIVADTEPSSRVWQQIERQVREERRAAAPPKPVQHKKVTRRPWWGWLIGAGAEYPVPGDPRFAWQRRLHAFDMRAPVSVLRIVEGKLPAMRLVS